MTDAGLGGGVDERAMYVDSVGRFFGGDHEQRLHAVQRLANCAGVGVVDRNDLGVGQARGGFGSTCEEPLRSPAIGETSRDLRTESPGDASNADGIHVSRA